MAGETQNRWVARPDPAEKDATVPQAVAPANSFSVVRPQPGAVDHPAQGLPVGVTPVSAGSGWWWLGCHGGAGVTTLEHAVPGGRDAHRMWPAGVPGWPAHPVVLVCRSSYGGLTAAQRAAAQWASGALLGVDLLGLVVVADAPGRLPRPLRDFCRLVSGGVPQTWTVPWVEPWRLGNPPTTHQPSELGALRRTLTHHTHQETHRV
ncbi:hypothetical protein GCM10010353_59690 [Streptomyces chryseus]|nr:hypothetical protein GCM10010353_59690 [Streptomyces chryseus]